MPTMAWPSLRFLRTWVPYDRASPEWLGPPDCSLAASPALQVSVAAKSLCWWVLSVAHTLRTQKECDLRLSRIREGEERLANTNAYIRKWVAGCDEGIASGFQQGGTILLINPLQFCLYVLLTCGEELGHSEQRPVHHPTSTVGLSCGCTAAVPVITTNRHVCASAPGCAAS